MRLLRVLMRPLGILTGLLGILMRPLGIRVLDVRDGERDDGEEHPDPLILADTRDDADELGGKGNLLSNDPWTRRAAVA